MPYCNPEDHAALTMVKFIVIYLNIFLYFVIMHVYSFLCDILLYLLLLCCCCTTVALLVHFYLQSFTVIYLHSRITSCNDCEGLSSLYNCFYYVSCVCVWPSCMLGMTRYCHDVDKAHADPMMQPPPPPNTKNIKTCCECY